LSPIPIREREKMELRNRKVMVTGGAGFIGSALVRELLLKGCRVVVYDNFVSGDMANLESVKSEVKMIEGDVRDPNFAATLATSKAELLFNLAAEPYIPGCYDRPRDFFEVNASGTLNVMLACLETGIKRVLHYSSSEVYGNAMRVPMDEEHPTCPQSTYATSKLAADRLCYTLHHEQRLPVIIMRQFNVYGPRETHPYVIPELISQLSLGNKAKLGNVEARRDLTYVDDAAHGAVRLMKCDEAMGKVVNLGSGVDWSVAELAKVIGNQLGWDEIDITIDKARLRPLDVNRLYCDNTRIKQMIGWTPEISLVDGLRKTIDWYERNGRHWIWETKMGPEEEIWQDRKGKADRTPTTELNLSAPVEKTNRAARLAGDGHGRLAIRR
jgi:nucleoside-diphosphate-sugar epimerase